MQTETVLSRREATLRSAATASLAGIALVQAVGLPSLLSQGRPLAVLSVTAVALCVGLGWALAVAPAGAAARVWRGIAATAVLAVAGWAAPRSFPVPGLIGPRVHWMAMPAAALAVVCLGLAVAQAQSLRAAARQFTRAAVVLAMIVGVLVLVLAPAAARTGPGSVTGDSTTHAEHKQFEDTIRFQAGSGRNGSHFLVPVARPAHETPLGIALLATTALLFASGAAGAVRR